MRWKLSEEKSISSVLVGSPSSKVWSKASEPSPSSYS
jgi:hypothetical protein